MYDYKDKKANVRQLNAYMIAKTLSMFEYEGLPEDLPSVELERLLQLSGYAFVTEVEGVLYAFNGGLGGVPDVYGNPTEITISNPALKFNKTLSLKDDGVLFISDSCRQGLLPLFNKHNALLVENDINMVMYGYNTRIQKIISAGDDKTKASAELYLKKTIDGDIGVIGENGMFDGVKTQGGAGDGSGSVMPMIEYHQYIKTSMYNEIGLGQNHNMKKERLVSAEVNQIKDSIYPFIYDMLKCRLKGVEKLNAKYGLKVAVDFGSVWNVNVKSYVDDVVDTAPAQIANTPVVEEVVTEGATAPEVVLSETELKLTEISDPGVTIPKLEGTELPMNGLNSVVVPAAGSEDKENDDVA